MTDNPADRAREAVQATRGRIIFEEQWVELLTEFAKLEAAEARRAAFEECANLVAKMCPCPVMSSDEEDEVAIRTYEMIEQAIRAKAAT